MLILTPRRCSLKERDARHRPAPLLAKGFMCSHKRRPPFEEPPLKVCETADFLAAVVPEAATETRTAPAPAIGACMTRAIAAATTISVIVNPNAAAPMSVVMTVIMVGTRVHFAATIVMVHFHATLLPSFCIFSPPPPPPPPPPASLAATVVAASARLAASANSTPEIFRIVDNSFFAYAAIRSNTP